ncbi:MAG: AAA family ATPase [Candidatus Helarchaeota archaeon]
MINKAYALVGMPGSGKSEIIKVGKELGFTVVAMGDVIRDDLKEKGIEITPKNMGKYAIEIRKRYGMDIVAKRTYEKISKLKIDTIIIDGLRNYEEVEYFKSKIKNFYIIAVFSSQKTRFNRLKERKREDDSIKWEVFLERDEREISMGIAKLIALADYMLNNEEELKIVQEKFKNILLGNIKIQ